MLDGADGSDVDGVPVVGGRRELVDYCLAASLDEVIISADRATEESLKEEMENIAAMGLTIMMGSPSPTIILCADNAARFSMSPWKSWTH